MELRNMIDLTSDSPEGESSKLKKFMGKNRPGILKSKFLTVLGNSNELLNRISNKLETTLDLSSSDSDYCDDDETLPPVKFPIITEDDTIDFSAIDFDARRVKARRAHEEIISGRFRHPNLIPKMPQHNVNGVKPISSSTSSDDNSLNNFKRSSSYSNSVDSDDMNHQKQFNENLKVDIHNNDLSNKTPEIDVISPISECNEVTEKSPTKLLNAMTNLNGTHNLQKISNSSTLTSLNDPVIPISGSLESDLHNCVQSDTENSVPSWASSISLDTRTSEEQAAKEFMKEFIEILFSNCSGIGFELKSEFGIKVRHDFGRLWFSRFVNAQRTKSKHVDETTFYSLVQHFAIVLFECADSEDYSPAKTLMNMCFTFYHEIEVPGCEPYREYLFTYLRQQPIWHTLRFWNAAFFDALLCERAHHRPVPKIHNIKSSNRQTKQMQRKLQNKKSLDDEKFLINSRHQQLKHEQEFEKNQSLPQSENDDSSDSENQENAIIVDAIKEDTKYQQNITFGQLGTFTCNMHAFGLNKDLCLEFLHKQCVIANLPKEQAKLLHDNINRMYNETELWGA